MMRVSSVNIFIVHRDHEKERIHMLTRKVVNLHLPIPEKHQSQRYQNNNVNNYHMYRNCKRGFSLLDVITIMYSNYNYNYVNFFGLQLQLQNFSMINYNYVQNVINCN